MGLLAERGEICGRDGVRENCLAEVGRRIVGWRSEGIAWCGGGVGVVTVDELLPAVDDEASTPPRSVSAPPPERGSEGIIPSLLFALPCGLLLDVRVCVETVLGRVLICSVQFSGIRRGLRAGYAWKEERGRRKTR